MKILSVASEVFPLIKTGGLADVAGALPLALKPHGIRMRTLLPGYPVVMQKIGQNATKATASAASIISSAIPRRSLPSIITASTSSS